MIPSLEMDALFLLPGATFYPPYTTHGGGGEDGHNEGSNNWEGGSVCQWQLGDGEIPGTTNNFGGTPASAYGTLLFIPYQTGPNSADLFTGNHQRKLSHNPCKVERTVKLEDQVEKLVHLNED